MILRNNTEIVWLLDDIISKDAYDEKYRDFTDKINKYKEEYEFLIMNMDEQKNIAKRMKELRKKFQISMYLIRLIELYLKASSKK